MAADDEQEAREILRSPTRADFYRYTDQRRPMGEDRGWIAIDKTTAMIVGSIASAALAVAIAAGTALVGKVDETARDVERGRAERIADFGEVSKNISVIETKLNQLIGQLTQLELRVERTVAHDFEVRDKKYDQLERQMNDLRDEMNGFDRERRRSK